MAATVQGLLSRQASLAVKVASDLRRDRDLYAGRGRRTERLAAVDATIQRLTTAEPVVSLRKTLSWRRREIKSDKTGGRLDFETSIRGIQVAYLRIAAGTGHDPLLVVPSCFR